MSGHQELRERIARALIVHACCKECEPEGGLHDDQWVPHWMHNECEPVYRLRGES